MNSDETVDNSKRKFAKLNGLRIFLAGLIPVIVYFALTQDTVSAFQSAGCTIRTGPPPPEPFIRLAMIANILGYSAPVWAAMLMASPRKFPKAYKWLIAFAALYGFLFFVIMYLGSSVDVRFSDDCSSVYERRQPKMFEWTIGSLLTALLSGFLIAVFAGVWIAFKKNRSGKLAKRFNFKSFALALIMISITGGLLGLHHKNKKNQKSVQATVDTIILTVAIQNKEETKLDEGTLRKEAQTLLEQQNNDNKISGELLDFKLSDDLMLSVRLSGTRSLLPIWTRTYTSEAAIQLHEYNGCEMITFERTGTNKCMPEDRCVLIETLASGYACEPTTDSGN